MLLPAHAGFGWLLANLGHGDRRFRGAVFLAALLPDLDGLTAFWSQTAYNHWHHTLTHNLLFSLIVSLVAARLCRNSYLKTFVFTQLAFYSHYFGDYLLTDWHLIFLWPFSHERFFSPYAIELGHPANYILALLALLYIAAVGIFLKRTPVEIISPAFDERLVRMFFQKKTLPCHLCGKKSNEHCSSCGKPVCIRHGILGKGCSVICRQCLKPESPATE